LEPHLFPSAEVLCVGCGPGTILRAVSAAYPKVTGTGIDISQNRIQIAKESNFRNQRLRFFTGDAHQMQFASASFDLVYARMLLQYAAHKERAVNEMVRVCRPGGTVLMQDLDGQLVWHYPEESLMQQTIDRVLKSLSK